MVQERLRDHRRAELSRVYAHVGADADWWDDALLADWHVGGSTTPIPTAVAAEFEARVADDIDRLREIIGDDLPK